MKNTESGVDFTNQELAACARRELAYRKRVYPRLIDNETMTPAEALRETQMMRAIVELLEDMDQRRLSI